MSNQNANQKPEEQKTTNPTTPTTQPAIKMATIVKGNPVNVRKQPAMESEVVTLVYKGEKVELDKVTNGWAHVKTSSDKVGYIKAEFVKEDKEG